MGGQEAIKRIVMARQQKSGAKEDTFGHGKILQLEKVTPRGNPAIGRQGQGEFADPVLEHDLKNADVWPG
jgi:hypothetical protein